MTLKPQSDAQRASNAAWLRAQLEDLAGHLAMANYLPSHDEMRRIVRSIAGGREWRIDAAAQRTTGRCA